MDNQINQFLYMNLQRRKIQVTDTMADAISPVWDAQEILYYLAVLILGWKIPLARHEVSYDLQ